MSLRSTNNTNKTKGGKAMNTVNISGMILDEPRLREEQNGAQHLTFRLGVRHRTAAGEWRKEAYKVSAWHKAARWGSENLEKGALVHIQGYLTQHQMKTGEMSFTFVEIVAEEFAPLRIVSAVRSQRGIPAQVRDEAKPDIPEIPDVPSVEAEYPIAGA